MKRLLLAALLVAFTSLAAAQSNPNQCFNVLPSAARTAAAVNSNTLSNGSWRGVTLILNVTAFTSGQYILNVQAPIPATPTVFYTILASTAVATTVGMPLIFTVYPGITASNNVTANAILPRSWRVNLAGTSTPSMTFSIDACYAN